MIQQYKNIISSNYVKYDRFYMNVFKNRKDDNYEWK